MCPICSGWARYLGMLGRLLWFRCLDCGIEWHQELEDGECDSVED